MNKNYLLIWQKLSIYSDIYSLMIGNIPILYSNLS